jgi:hypothetical protein
MKRDHMKMLAGYLEESISFEQMAAEEKDLKLKAEFDKQAAAYRNFAAARAKKYFGERVASRAISPSSAGEANTSTHVKRASSFICIGLFNHGST